MFTNVRVKSQYFQFYCEAVIAITICIQWGPGVEAEHSFMYKYHIREVRMQKGLLEYFWSSRSSRNKDRSKDRSKTLVQSWLPQDDILHAPSWYQEQRRIWMTFPSGCGGLHPADVRVCILRIRLSQSRTASHVRCASWARVSGCEISLSGLQMASSAGTILLRGRLYLLILPSDAFWHWGCYP